ncbi:MAG: peptide chain release factor N(5)-glutamine methyltransferase [Acidobacteriaceae bacterium]|nr:peptide chain release factor N(5)-glutamine methyltransferase [Acidobacteriaceae bacterium]
MLDIRTALQQGTALLEQGLISAPRLTAEVLLCHALRVEDRSYLYAHPEQPLTELAWIHYGRYLHERLSGKPTQYITKRQEFYGREFRVTRDVLIPRPETEHLVETAMRHVREGDLVLDVGTGSGAIAVTLALETKGRVIGCDLSLPALAVAKANASRLGAKVSWLVADLASCVARRSLDVLVSNPPYVPSVDEPGLQREVRDWEPRLALFAGPTGVEIYESLIRQAREVVRPGGWLLFELGYNALAPVQNMLRDAWTNIEVVHDLAGFPRVIAAQLKST